MSVTAVPSPVAAEAFAITSEPAPEPAAGYRTWPDPDTKRTGHGKVLISAPSQRVMQQHWSDTDHPGIKRSAPDPVYALV